MREEEFVWKTNGINRNGIGRRSKLWKDVPEEKWNDWLWQLTHTVRTLEDLKKVINLTKEEEEGVRISTKTIPLNITPYYASLMDPDN